MTVRTAITRMKALVKAASRSADQSENGGLVAELLYETLGKLEQYYQQGYR